MEAKEILSDVVPVLQTSESGQKALNWMEIFRISHLPVIDEDGDYVGIISDNDIYDFNLSEKSIGNHKISFQRPFVNEETHIYEVISLVTERNLTIIPVLNKLQSYVGVITLHDLMQQFGKLVGHANSGAVFVLEMNQNDYSFAQVAQIVEGNDAKILSAYFNLLDDGVTGELTVKINTPNFGAVRQTLERYDYTVKKFYFTNDDAEKALDEKYDEFISYLNI